MINLPQASSPAVSIVIPTYNQNPDYLRDAVESALSQTFRDIEVIVSDNHSTNGAPRALDTISDSRLRVIQPPEHLPMVEHFAFAGENANGEFISFLASDDLLYPDWLEDLLPLFAAHPQATFGFGEIEKVSHDSTDTLSYYFRKLSMPTGYYSAEQMLPMLMKMDRASGWLVGDLIRVGAYRGAGGIGRDKLRYCADYALSLRLLESGGGAVYLNRPVAKNRAWDARDGKMDALRIRAAAADIAEIFSMLSANTPLKPLVEKFSVELKNARKNKARFMALALLSALALDEIDAAFIPDTKADIRRIDSGSVSTRLLLALGHPSLAKPLRSVYPTALRFARSRLGQALLKL